MSTSSKTMTGALPPSSRCTRFRSRAAEPATSMPARTDPVIDTMAGVRSATSARPGVTAAGDDVEHARGQELGADLGEQQRRGRGVVGGLQHDGVAGRDRGRELPDRHHHRVVPRRHLADDADRLAADEARVVGHVLAGRLALEVASGTREESHLVDHDVDLVGDDPAARLAGVLHLDVGEFLGAVGHGIREPPQRERALRRRRPRPRSRTRRKPPDRPSRRPVRSRPAPSRRPLRSTGRGSRGAHPSRRRRTCRRRSS